LCILPCSLLTAGISKNKFVLNVCLLVLDIYYLGESTTRCGEVKLPYITFIIHDRNRGLHFVNLCVFSENFVANILPSLFFWKLFSFMTWILNSKIVATKTLYYAHLNFLYTCTVVPPNTKLARSVTSYKNLEKCEIRTWLNIMKFLELLKNVRGTNKQELMTSPPCPHKKNLQNMEISKLVPIYRGLSAKST